MSPGRHLYLPGEEGAVYPFFSIALLDRVHKGLIALFMA